METMTKRKDAKYAATHQTFSEVRLHYHPDGSASVVRGDINQLREAVHNACANPVEERTEHLETEQKPGQGPQQ